MRSARTNTNAFDPLSAGGGPRRCLSAIAGQYLLRMRGVPSGLRLAGRPPGDRERRCQVAGRSSSETDGYVHGGSTGFVREVCGLVCELVRDCVSLSGFCL